MTAIEMYEALFSQHQQCAADRQQGLAPLLNPYQGQQQARTIGPFPSGAQLQVSGDKIVGRTYVHEGTYAAGGASGIVDHFTGVVVTVGGNGGGGGGGTRDRLQGAVAKVAATCEPKRPALTWNTKTKFDPFKGFTVRSDTGWLVDEHSHALQRMSDASNPLHGSAFLAD